MDSEPVHLGAFQQVLEPLGIELTSDAYYARYVGYDDHAAFVAILCDQGRSPSEPLILELIAAKTLVVQTALERQAKPLPGVLELMQQAELAVTPIAVCSGALRRELELGLRGAGVRDYVMTLVCAEDVTQSKPNPQGYRLALANLSRLTGRALLAERTAVIEDTPFGIQAAKAAGMKVLAVGTSASPAELRSAGADLVVPSLTQVTFTQLGQLTAG